MDVHELVTDELWAYIEPLLPPHPPHPQGGNDWKPDRPALCGIIDVLQEGSGWTKRPLALGCGSGRTCRRRFRGGRAAGGWPRLQRVLLEKLAGAEAIAWSRVSVDSASVPAKQGAPRPAPARRIGASRAPRTTSRSSGRASRRRRG